MTDGGPQKPGESDRDYIRRLSQASAEQQQAAQDAAIEERMQGEAQAERIRNALEREDANWSDDIKDLLGSDFNQAVIDIQRYKINTPGLDRAISDIQSADAAWTQGGRRRKRKRMTRKHKGTLKNAGKQLKRKRSWFGCAVVSVLMFGAFGSGLWGLYEAGSALVTAMAR